MAKVVLSPLVSSISGKLGNSVFLQSGSTFSLKSRVRVMPDPKDPEKKPPKPPTV